MRWTTGAIALGCVVAIITGAGVWAAGSAQSVSAPLVQAEQDRMRALLEPAIPGPAAERWVSEPCEGGGERFEYRRTATVTSDPEGEFEQAIAALTASGVHLFEGDGMMFSYDRWLVATEAGDGFGYLTLGLANDDAQHAVSADPGHEPDPSRVPAGGNAVEAKVDGRCIATVGASDQVGSLLEPLLLPALLLLFVVDGG
jgi:hypothetical protein